MLLKKIKIITLILIVVMQFSTYVYADDIDEEEEDISETISLQTEIEVSNQNNDEPVTNSRRCVIYDRVSKTVLYGKNENVKSAMASTTKIMTALVVLENANLNDTVEVSKKAAGTGGSRLGLKTADKITVNDLLYGLMLKSGNDAAVALAEYVGENVEGFSILMNQKAEELGLKNTHFVTPHGLDNSEHYTTALELAKLADIAMGNEQFSKIVGTKSITININGDPRQIYNTNELLGVLDGVVGIKTGFTNNAGRCLVTEVKRGDMDIITVVLGADTKKDRTKDSIKLIEYAYSNFEMVNIEEKIFEEFTNWKNINENRIEIIKAKQTKLSLALGEIALTNMAIKSTDIDKIEYEINTITQIEAPVEQYKKIGTMIVKLNGEIIESIDIITTRKIEKKGVWDYIKEELEIIPKLTLNALLGS